MSVSDVRDGPAQGEPGAPDATGDMLSPVLERGVLAVGGGLLALSVLAGFALGSKGYFGIDGTFGFGAWFGLLTCGVLVLVGKGLGQILSRPDTTYDE